MERSIEMCYVTEKPKTIESYFEVVSQVLFEYPELSRFHSDLTLFVA
jgi:hypothetical protein